MKKACGYDFIPAKMLKLGATVICNSLTPIAKKAEISPMYKKNDNLENSIYRPVSILTALSKVFEGLLCDQLSTISINCSMSCNNVLVKCIEDFRKALDLWDCIGCVLIDLSSAFDSIPHGLRIAKLNAYGVSMEACSYIMNYLSDRNQSKLHIPEATGKF